MIWYLSGQILKDDGIKSQVHDALSTEYVQCLYTEICLWDEPIIYSTLNNSVVE